MVRITTTSETKWCSRRTRRASSRLPGISSSRTLLRVRPNGTCTHLILPFSSCNQYLLCRAKGYRHRVFSTENKSSKRRRRSSSSSKKKLKWPASRKPPAWPSDLSTSPVPWPHLGTTSASPPPAGLRACSLAPQPSKMFSIGQLKKERKQESSCVPSRVEAPARRSPSRRCACVAHCICMSVAGNVILMTFSRAHCNVILMNFSET